MQTFRGQVREGMTVYAADGHKLGRIIRCEADSFIVEKGFFFPKDYLARYELVVSVDGDEVRLSGNAEDLRRLEGAEALARDTGEVRDETLAGGISRETGAGEVRIPVTEEQLDARKVTREAGAVEVRKVAVTEQKQITVPVTREEVHVERRAVNEPVRGDTAAFKNETIRVPVMEEEVEVRKRPVVREEVLISKTPHTEQRVASETVRREEVTVDHEGETRRRDRRDDTDPGVPMLDEDPRNRKT